MKHLWVSFLALSVLASAHAWQNGEAGSDSIFRHFYGQAVAYADAYPREKAYLHFDNTSYYVGDTIWFKAYVTLAGQETFSPLSRPLYVELLDQTGHVVQKQIVRLDGGEGRGQIVLPASAFSGYYEVRAYTRWMLGFGEPDYFSRTFPVYQAREAENEERTITAYRLNPGMEQRPEAAKEALAMQFFPEGGSLVEGVPSKVAFKAESRDEGSPSPEGAVYDSNGLELARIETLHDGMGVFAYTPSGRPAVARVRYKGKDYRFDLPEALPAGYVLGAEQAGGGIVYHVACNGATPAADVAVLVSREGRPCALQVMRPDDVRSGKNFLFRPHGLPGGIYQFSVLDCSGKTLCERFCFVQPRRQMKLEVSGTKEVYRPYEAVRCEIRAADRQGNPVSGRMSVAVRDAVRSDYAEYDNTLFTDLLLTSGLKGYIHQPGYYFCGVDMRKQQELDVLLMVHGWRKYDMSVLTSDRPAVPLRLPEKSLLLEGRVKSTVLKRDLADMEVSVMAKDDTIFVAGQTVTDGEGRFSIPVSGFDGEVEALFQTRRRGSRRKKDASVRLDRNFSPAPRAYGYAEFHPDWGNRAEWRREAYRSDSLLLDSLRRADGAMLLDEIVVSARNRQPNLTTKVYEQSVDAYYDVQQSVDELRDRGKYIQTVPDLMLELNRSFYYDPRNYSCLYKMKTICCVMDGKVLDPMAAWMIWNQVDGLKQILICEGENSVAAGLDGSLGIQTDVMLSAEQTAKPDRKSRTFDDYFYAYSDAQKNNFKNNTDSIPMESFRYNINNNIDLSQLGRYAIFYLVPQEGKDVLNKNMEASRGTRRTVIQGYTRPLEFYSPVYADKLPDQWAEKDRRRTLYWNPSVETDAEGRAVVEFRNGSFSVPVVVQAEMLAGGMAGSVTCVSLPAE